YAALLARQILRREVGGGRAYTVWEGIREGANAYLKRQFKSILLVIAILAFALYFSSVIVGGPPAISI
ncbi:sodium/proton-translocating pyrophosphatase, partial [Candidatus Bathyarchaeota archaeon]|nr:sodium/proton-translocating pyrophosphatase [Candidatus Bathyarchaeota archaeon]